MTTIGRNDPCPCGSGSKYKKCCLRKEQQQQANELKADRLAPLLVRGYDHSTGGHGQRACDVWSEVWQVVSGQLRPEMKTCKAVDEVFPDIQFFANWVDDFIVALLNASRDEPRYAAMGVEFCEQVLRQVLDEDPRFRRGVRADLGELLLEAGRDAEGERVFNDLIAEFPENAVGYVLLADRLQRRSRETGSADATRAEELLRKALPLPDAADFDVAARLEGFESRSG